MNFEELTPELQELAIDNNYEYIKTKAKNYIEIGADRYRKGDAFQMPLCNWTEEDLVQIESGCKQLLDYKGLTIEDSFKGLTIVGFYNLMLLFHFNNVKRKTHYKNKPFIDEIVFKHSVSDVKIRLFNQPGLS